MQKSDVELAAAFMPLLDQRGVKADLTYVEKVVALVKERVQFVPELWEQAFFFFEAPVDFDAKVVQKRWKGEVPAFMEELARMFASCTTWEATFLKEKASELMQERGLGFGAVANALRLVLTGGAFGPDLFAIVELLGRDEVLGRIATAMQRLS